MTTFLPELSVNYLFKEMIKYKHNSYKVFVRYDDYEIVMFIDLFTIHMTLHNSETLRNIQFVA